MVLCSLKDFSEVDLDQKEKFESFFKKFPPRHSDASFVTMVSWHFYMGYFVCWVDGFPFVYTKKGDVRFFRIPFGLKDLDLIEKMLRFASKNASEFSIGLVDDAQKDFLSSHFKHLDFVKCREFSDYIYRAQDLVSLSGKSYAKIRNRMNKFQKNHSYSVEMISQGVVDEVINYLDEWCIVQDCDEDEVLRFEKLALKYCLRYFQTLGVFGLAIRVEGEIKAFSLCEWVSDSEVIVHFEKGDPKLDGIYKVVNFETAKYIVDKGGIWINRESDMGVIGLRKAKMRYRPHHLADVFMISKKSIQDEFSL